MDGYSYENNGGNIGTMIISVGMLMFSVIVIAGVCLKKIFKDTPLQMLRKIEE